MARIVLTQPLPRVQDLTRSLARRGHEVLALPFTRIEPRQLADLGDRLRGFQWVIAVSPAAVDALAEALGGAWPEPGPRLGLIGPGSLTSLRAGVLSTLSEDKLLHRDLPPYDARSLIDLPELADPSGQSMLVVRGEGGREDWIELLRTRGARVETMALYDRLPAEPGRAERERLATWLQHHSSVFCMFTQTASIGSLCALPEARGLAGPGSAGVALAIHERIAEEAHRAGFSKVRLIEPGESAIAAAIE